MHMKAHPHKPCTQKSCTYEKLIYVNHAHKSITHENTQKTCKKKSYTHENIQKHIYKKNHIHVKTHTEIHVQKIIYI